MKVLLVNLDSTIPNLALHKIAMYHRLNGDRVRQIKDIESNALPDPLLIDMYDKIYVSCIFLHNKYRCDKWEGVAEIGGSGYSLKKNLPSEIEAMKPKINWGFITRGCIRKCLDGNTLINTVLGEIPIKNLVGKKIGVWTYNRKTGEAYISKATKVWCNGKKDCVRVNFDDGSSIVCTPDHRFLTFKNGNQHSPTREIVKEAKDLKCKDSVIALKKYHDPKYGVNVHCRRKEIIEHQAVMEYVIGRKLIKGETIHHSDKDNYNNLPDNLDLCKNASDHQIRHHSVERSRRMKEHNPMKNSNSVEKMVKTSQERKPKGSWCRTYEQRLKYRQNKLGKLNPNYKDGKTCGQTRLKETNHKVVSVEFIGKRKVYDMYVPETNWFFANNVLVHNCPWCIVPEKEGKIHEVCDIYDIWDGKADELILMDNNILALPKTFFKTCKQLKKENLKVDFNQGLDHRLLTDKICKELFSLRLGKKTGEKLRFAFDDVSYERSVKKALDMLEKNGLKKWHSRWYIYVSVKDTPETVLSRINQIRERTQSVFVMRDRDERVMQNEEFKKIYTWSTNQWCYYGLPYSEFRKDYVEKTVPTNGLDIY